MNILLVSQCNKNALKETRKILDQFAERCGERTWQTPITYAGLETLRRLLRKSARKNTAVACHWIRGRNHSELLWIVGDTSRFNIQGAVPTNTTSRDILRSGHENDWRTGEDITLLAALAALMHDLGKSCVNFQKKLRPNSPQERNLYRHEWISLRLFEAFVGKDGDEAWLKRLRSTGDGDGSCWLSHLCRDGLDDSCVSPFQNLPPLAAAIGWLILTHHRLPVKPQVPAGTAKKSRFGARVSGFKAEQLRDLPAIITADWNEECDTQDKDQIRSYWEFDSLPVITPLWRQRAGHLAERILRRLVHREQTWLDNPYVMHLARLSLMLADHYYSSLTEPEHRVRGVENFPLWANTNRNIGGFNQPLDEHLLGVEKHSQAVSRSLPGLEHCLPRIARHKGFRKRSEIEHFRWQDKAFDLAASLRHRTKQSGFFGVNMASTGCGKTLANGRILYALADPDQGARFSVALGLRTLTLQTGKAYRRLLRLGEDELAIRVGGSASRILFEHYEEQAELSGSASSQRLIEEDSHVYFEGDFENHALLRRLSHDPAAKSLVSAPILVCTVDHLVPATESQRGGRQIAPMLRLMSGDLVLDELDDFDIEDLPALTRLVYWAGLFGSRILLSSATLPPSLLEGLFSAYKEGREHYQCNRGEPGQPVNICCGWFDESDRCHHDCATTSDFIQAHKEFANRRMDQLYKQVARRCARIMPLPNMISKERKELHHTLAEQLMKSASLLHKQNHSVDPHSGKRVSFGLVRMANIEPLFRVAQALYELGPSPATHVHLCVYHSRYPLLMRSDIENRLDRALDRRCEKAVFDIPEIRRCIDTKREADQLFIVLGSPVTEVGRDHDYDWAIVEPSSVRSFIQIAGRVRRHRAGACKEYNMLLLDTNLKHLEQPDKPAFCRPGFETLEWRLSDHTLSKLLMPEEYEVIDACPRIFEREELRPQDSLVDLEHSRLKAMMIPKLSVCKHIISNSEELSPRQRRMRQWTPPAPALGAYSCYSIPRVTLTGVLAQQQPFREQTLPEVDLILMPDESGETWRIQKIWESGKGRRQQIYLDIESSLMERLNLDVENRDRISCWGQIDYMQALINLAEELDMSLEECAKSFGIVKVPESNLGWRFHPALGFAVRH